MSDSTVEVPNRFAELMAAWLSARRFVLGALDFGVISNVQAHSELSVMATIVNAGIDSADLEVVARRFRQKAYHFRMLATNDPAIEERPTPMAEPVETLPPAADEAGDIWQITVSPDDPIYFKLRNAAICQAHAAGFSYGKLAKRYGISKQRIAEIIKGRSDHEA